MAKVITSANQKGGVGKSTTTINLSRAAAHRGHRVLLVDFDSQGNSTSALVQEPLERDGSEIIQQTVADTLLPRGAVPLRKVIVPSIWEGIDVAPACETLSAAEEMIMPSHGREFKLREVLEPVKGDYDVVLIDSPPSLGQLTVNALTASDAVLVVSQPHPWSADGMALLARTVANVQKYFNPALVYAGVLINMWQGTTEARATNRNKQVLAEIEEYFTAAPILRPFIPARTLVGEAIDAGIPLDEWKSVPARMIAEDYATHLDAILQRIGG